MKFNTASSALVLALATSTLAAPATPTTENSVSQRDLDRLNLAIADIEHIHAKRELMSDAELTKREYEIVTEVLSAIKDSGLAPKIIIGLTTDSTLGPLSAKAIVAVLKSGLINLGTLLKALVDTGLINSVIEGLISDCDFYAQIYKLALSYIDDLVSLISKKLSKRETIEYYLEPTFELVARASGSSDSVVDNLLDSLKLSGLATSVVKSLITDSSFLSYGASLIQQIIQSGALSLSDLLSAIKVSGIVPSLFKEFFNFDTLKTVTVNALAAAFGNCDGSSVTKSVGPATTTITESNTLTGVATPTATNIVVCRRKKRSYNY